MFERDRLDLLNSHSHEFVSGAGHNLVTFSCVSLVDLCQVSWFNFIIPVFVVGINVAVVGGKAEASEDIYSVVVTGGLRHLDE